LPTKESLHQYQVLASPVPQSSHFLCLIDSHLPLCANYLYSTLKHQFVPVAWNPLTHYEPLKVASALSFSVSHFKAL